MSEPDLLSLEETAYKVGLGPKTLLRMCAEDNFPAPVNLGFRRTKRLRFFRKEIDAWIEMLARR